MDWKKQLAQRFLEIMRYAQDSGRKNYSDEVELDGLYQTICQYAPTPDVAAMIEELLRAGEGRRFTIDQPRKGRWRISCGERWAVADTWQKAILATVEHKEQPNG